MLAKHVSIRFYAYPEESLTRENGAIALLDALEADSRLTPTSWGLDEREHNAYDRAQAERGGAVAVESHGDLHVRRDRVIRYSGYFSFGTPPFLTLDIGKGLASSRWPDVEKLADRVAAGLRVRFAILHAFRPSPFPWTNEEEKLQRWLALAAQPVPVRFRPNGPLGLGARTYFGGDILQMFGEDRLLGTPGLTTKLDWGGVRIDLGADTWSIGLPELAVGWKKAMDHLEPCGALAAPIFEDDKRTVEFQPSPAWIAHLKQMTVSSEESLRRAIERSRTAGQIASHLNISGVDFSNEDLSHAKGELLTAKSTRFRGAVLKRGSFKDCDFEGADFEGASLSETVFVDCVVSDANFRRADLEGAAINVSVGYRSCFDEATLTRAELSGSSFDGASCRNARLVEVSAKLSSFRDADMTGADLSGGDFTKADFRGAKLTDVIWEGANLSDAMFDDGKA